MDKQDLQDKKNPVNPVYPCPRIFEVLCARCVAARGKGFAVLLLSFVLFVPSW
jgi:hypothetical protein